MRNAYCVAGNSSMGLLETAFYKLRAINIGSRQKGRENPGNVIYVDNNKKDIINGFIKIKKIKMVNQYFYGDKHSAKNIYKIIKSIKLRDKKWLNKKKLCL